MTFLAGVHLNILVRNHASSVKSIFFTSTIFSIYNFKSKSTEVIFFLISLLTKLRMINVCEIINITKTSAFNNLASW